MNKIAEMNSFEVSNELSDQDLDTVSGGFLPFLVAAVIVVAVDVAMLAYMASHKK